ncbi:PREDICTED: dirigent protein 9-like [Nelumbo nucifera]|uniref:Dirigent protein n=2 Tax=Nelumbo nucifera TaxID=4432 RepID=A0A822ZYP7_NELNU|nr:PREDICTED: dirigent protein 9-like [Nelumbo nucifera]DAD47068.1 TPA_asm: hypothetical protein HUJ06_017005 [Nelumbo nucifera]
MAKHLSLASATLKTTIYVLLIAITVGCANSARTLMKEDVAPPAPATAPEASNPVTAPVPDAVPPAVTPVPDMAPEAAPAITQPSNGPAGVGVTTSSVTVTHPDADPPLSFFMHDILGGTAPSARVVTGIVASTSVNGIPFSRPNSGVFPVNGGVPLFNGNNGVINNNNFPFLAGLGGTTTSSTIVQNNGNNNVVNGGNNLPFVAAGQLPAGATLQKLMFGTITVVDDELTEGHELGSSVVGKAQGFYLASSLDGSSQTMVLTALFHGGDHEDDSISLFGVHRTAAPESQIAIVGGTGKYENAQGYATIQTIHPSDQHTTDGVETVLQFSVYLAH